MSRKEINNLNPDSELKSALFHLIENEISKFSKASKGKINLKKDKTVHNIRVAGRRIQTLLDTFGEIIPRDTIRKPYKRLKNIIKSLGKMRENDVALSLLSKYIKKNKKASDCGVLCLLMAKLQYDNEITQKTELHNTSILDYINYFNTQFLNEINSKEEKQFILYKTINPEISLRTNGIYLISKMYDRMLGCFRLIPGKNNARELHEIRKIAKSLRYTIEILSDVYKNSRDLDGLIKEIKKFVTRLGDIHDIDVLLKLLKGAVLKVRIFNKLQKTHQIDIQPAEELIKEISNKRSKLYKKVCKTILTWRSGSFREKLIKSLGT